MSAKGSKNTAKRKARLSKRVVDDLAAEGERYTVWDADLRGFCCEVGPTGTKSYRLVYRHDGRVRKLTIGRHGSVTLDEARNIARQATGDVAARKDPASEKSKARVAERSAVRVDNAFADWMRMHVKAKRKPITAKGYQNTYDNHAKPMIGRRVLGDITRADIAKLHRKSEASPYQANRAVAMLRSFFTWCERQGLRPEGSNPARLLEFYREQKRDRLLTAEELARLGAALSDLDGKEWPWALAAIRLLLFTGARRGEILGMRWTEIDLANGVARLPDSKTGAKTLYLSAPARDVLAAVPRKVDNPYVICGRVHGGPLIGLPHIWERIRDHAGLPGLRMHDLRHAFASTGAMGGMSLLTIGRLLGHSQPAVTDRYAHFASSPLVTAADTIGAAIAAQMAAKVPERDGNG